MLVKLFVSFTAVTLIELGLLIEIGNRIGLWWTLALVFATGFLGAYFVRSQGSRALRRIREDLEGARMPANPVMDGLLILIAGAFLLTPGVLTDLTGFALLVPPVRLPFKKWIRERFKRWITEGRVNVRFGEHRYHDVGTISGDIIDLTPEHESGERDEEQD